MNRPLVSLAASAAWPDKKREPNRQTGLFYRYRLNKFKLSGLCAPGSTPTTLGLYMRTVQGIFPSLNFKHGPAWLLAHSRTACVRQMLGIAPHPWLALEMFHFTTCRAPPCFLANFLACVLVGHAPVPAYPLWHTGMYVWLAEVARFLPPIHHLFFFFFFSRSITNSGLGSTRSSRSGRTPGIVSRETMVVWNKKLRYGQMS